MSLLWNEAAEEGVVNVGNLSADQLVHASNLDITLSALRDAVKGTSTLTDLATLLEDLDVDIEAVRTAVLGTLTVSGTVGVGNLPADQLVHASNLDIALSALRDAIKGGKTLNDIVAALASVPVTGTFWQATQPVSESHLANLDIAISALRDALRGSGNKTLTDLLNAITATLIIQYGQQATLFDYVGRNDSNPIYIGQAAPGTAQSAATWHVQKFAYDTSSRATSILNATGAWTSRASLSYS